MQNQECSSSSRHDKQIKFKQSQRRIKPTIQTSISIVNADAKKIFWTKASKCSKVVIPIKTGSQNPVDDNTVVPPPSMPNISGDLHRYWQFTSEDEDNNKNSSSSSDLMLDFEMDEELLSDLLNADFSLLNYNLENGAASETNTVCEHPKLSLNSEKTLLLLDDEIQDSGFPSMDALIEFGEINWIQDLENKGAAEEEKV